METVGKDVIRLLLWIDSKPCHRSGWMRSGRIAWGAPETWTHFRMSGREGQITVTTSTMDAARPMVEPTEDATHSMWRLNKAGKAAIKNHRGA